MPGLQHVGCWSAGRLTVIAIRYLDVCGGYSAPTVAWSGLGFECAGYSEIDPFPCALLEHRHGAVPVGWDHAWRAGSNVVPLFGDFTRIEANHVGPVDLLVGGTPCQAFSIAGKRLGLDDPRGNLTLEFLALARRLRPRWLVWENVAGVLSDDGGRTLGTFLGLLGQLGYGWSYRVLDAQHVRVGMFGRAVPQRRRRVFVVGCLGDEARAASVLFDRSSLRGDPAPRRQAGQGVAGLPAFGIDGDCLDRSGERAAGGRGARSGLGIVEGLSPTLRARRPHAVAHVADVAGTLASGGNSTGGARYPGTSADTAGTMLVAHAVNAHHHGRMDVTTDNIIAVDEFGEIAFPEFMSGTQVASTAGLSPTICARNPTAVATRTEVRRLTPLECERLQGLPDGFTAITYRGRPAADGPRYKAIGNGMAINVMRWIGERIAAVD